MTARPLLFASLLSLTATVGLGCSAPSADEPSAELTSPLAAALSSVSLGASGAISVATLRGDYVAATAEQDVQKVTFTTTLPTSPSGAPLRTGSPTRTHEFKLNVTRKDASTASGTWSFGARTGAGGSDGTAYLQTHDESGGAVSSARVTSFDGCTLVLRYERSLGRLPTLDGTFKKTGRCSPSKTLPPPIPDARLPGSYLPTRSAVDGVSGRIFSKLLLDTVGRAYGGTRNSVADKGTWSVEREPEDLGGKVSLVLKTDHFRENPFCSGCASWQMARTVALGQITSFDGCTLSLAPDPDDDGWRFPLVGTYVRSGACTPVAAPTPAPTSSGTTNTHAPPPPPKAAFPTGPSSLDNP